MDEQPKAPSVEAPWEDAYASHFCLVLTTVLHEREDYRELFSSEELDIAQRFLTLTPLQQQLYSRLFQRQGFWFKTTSLFRYFHDKRKVSREQEEQQQVPDHKLVQETIQRLVQIGYFNKFPTKENNYGEQEEDLGAIEHCASAPELVTLLKKISGSHKTGGKAGTLAAVKRVVKTQRRMDGSRIPVGNIMQEIWCQTYPLHGKQASDIMVVQMAPATRDLMQRMHRLFYLMATPPFNATSSMPQAENIVDMITLASQKLRQEPTQWPGLMALFKKVVYPEYELGKKTEISKRHAVFASPEAYACYEVASQLHRVMGVLEQCIQIETPDKEYQEPDLELKWIMTDGPPVFTAFRRLLLLLEDNEDTETEEEYLIVSGVDSTEDVLKEDDKTPGWQMQSWEKFYIEVEQMQSLDDLVLACRGCLQAYLKWINAATFNGTCSLGVPVFFAKCNAGYHLVRILSIAVALYEKMRRYQIATLLLNELLATPFLERKRGYWWDRLALNLEHLKCADQAQATCLNALEDPHILAADRIALERRLHRLQRLKERHEQKILDALSQNTDTGSDDREKVKEEVKTVRHCTYEYHKTYVVGRPLNRQTGEKSRFVGYDDEPCTVEQLVLQHYRDHIRNDEMSAIQTRGGWYGVHSEGSELVNFFGILLWDILYADIPNVFQTPFQAAPLDFGYAELFYESRRDLIDRRLCQIREKWTLKELLTSFAATWTCQYGKVSRFVRWPSDEIGSLKFHLLALAAIGRPELAKLLRYMATSKEFHQAQNGLPDLLLLKIGYPNDKQNFASQTNEWIMDSSGSLNVFALCGMDEQLNMNEKMPVESAAQPRSDTEKADDVSSNTDSLQSVLDVLNDESLVGHLKLVEVKGPRDRLSDKQLLWLQVFCEEVGLDASVMHVEEKEKQAKRKQKETTKSVSKKQSKRRK